MGGVTRPKGPLPARVYWTRRVVVLGMALGLVFGGAQLFGGDRADPETRTAQPAAAPALSPSDDAGQDRSETTTRRKRGEEERHAERGRGKKARENGRKGDRQDVRSRKSLPAPSGPCAVSDVRVTPSVDGKAFAGRDVTITLDLTTLRSPACTFQVSPRSVVLKLTSGSDFIWSSQDCPTAIRPEQVVVRKGRTTKVAVVWSGQRSDDECSRTTLWAEPGYYHATAAALGSEPADEQFRLRPPPRPRITPSPEPKGAREGTEER